MPFTIKLFRSGTREPDAVEFYSTESPVVKSVKNPASPNLSHQVEITNGHQAEEIDIMKGDALFIENEHGTTIHSIR